MPSLDDLRKRITSVKSTQKITKAMKMVAAAKLRNGAWSESSATLYLSELREVQIQIARAAIL